MLSQFETVRTTVSFPKPLIDRLQRLIDSGIAPSRNALVVTALEQYVQELEREAIDRAFDAMSGDNAYQALNESIADAFAESDWEAWREGEAS